MSHMLSFAFPSRCLSAASKSPGPNWTYFSNSLLILLIEREREVNDKHEGGLLLLEICSNSLELCTSRAS